MGVEFELVLPCFNEAPHLPLVVERFLGTAAEKGYGPERFQLVLVNNGSTDNTPKVLEQLLQTPWSVGFRVLTLRENQGYGGGLKAGLECTQAPIVGFAHADLQCDPTDVFRALAHQRNNGGLVKGSRRGRRLSEIFISRCFDLSARGLLGIGVWDINAQPKIFPRELIDRLKSPPTGISFDCYVLLCAQKAGMRVRSIALPCAPRRYGRSHWAHSLTARWQTYYSTFLTLWRLRRLSE